MEIRRVRTVDYHTESGRVRAVDFVSVPSRLIAESLEIETTRTGALQPGEPFTHDSIIGSIFTATASFLSDGSVLPVVTGMAYPTGEHEFIVDPDDPLPPFVLR